MKCPICGTDAVPGVAQCPGCGCRISEEPHAPVSPFDPDYVRPPRRQKTWLWIALPLVLVCVLIIGFFGFCAATLLSRPAVSDPVESVSPADPADPTVPSIDAPVKDLPAAASEDCFAIVDGTLLFQADTYDGGPVLRVPDTVGGVPVTAIGPNCFSGCSELTTILLPDTVTAIHREAFAGCTELRGLLVPAGTTYIGKDAFDGCIKLESISIPASVTTIESGAFDDCASLMYIFYDGSFGDWNDLYSDYITPFTFAICSDSQYYHGVK